MIINHQSPRARALVSRARDRQLRVGFPYRGSHFSATTESRVAINSRVIRNMATDSQDMVTWRTTMDTNHIFTPQDFADFQVEMDKWVESKYVSAWITKQPLKKV